MMKNFQVRMSDQRERETAEREEKKGSLVAEAHQNCANLMGCPGKVCLSFLGGFWH